MKLKFDNCTFSGNGTAFIAGGVTIDKCPKCSSTRFYITDFRVDGSRVSSGKFSCLDCGYCQDIRTELTKDDHD